MSFQPSWAKPGKIKEVFYALQKEKEEQSVILQPAVS